MQNKRRGDGYGCEACGFGQFPGRQAALALALAVCITAVSACGRGAAQRADQETGEVTNEEISKGRNVKTGETTEIEEGKTEIEEDKTEIEEDKTEIVYGKLTAEGVAEKVTSEIVLHCRGQKGEIEDYSTLTDIVNQKGEEEYTRRGNTLIWQNLGEDIAYKGSAGRDLPVTLEAAYFMNEKRISPGELAGQSGEIRIRWAYTNHTAAGNGETAVPFTVLFILPLDEDIFSDIRVTNGRLIEMEGQSIVTGMAFPGWRECLPLQKSRLTEELELTDYVEIQAHAEGFEMGVTTSVITAGIWEELDENTLRDLEDIPQQAQKFKTAIRSLVRGGEGLCEGSRAFQKGWEEYQRGVESLDTGAENLRDGLRRLNEEKYRMREGAAALQSGLAELDKAVSMLESVSGGDMIAMQLAPAVRSLKEGSEKLTAGITEFNSGVEKAYLGSVELKDGMGELRKGGAGLTEGLQSLEEGNTRLLEGLRVFRKETESRLDETAGEGLGEILAGLRGMKEAGAEYNSYSGIREGMEGKVTFWLETEKISSTVKDTERP